MKPGGGAWGAQREGAPPYTWKKLQCLKLIFRPFWTPHNFFLIFFLNPSLREGLKKWGFSHICFWPTHPPPKCGKNKNKILFFGIFSSFGTKKNFWSFFTLPLTTATHLSYQLPPPIPATNYWCTPLLTPTMLSDAVVDACGCWYQWWLALAGVRGGGLVVLVGSDGWWWQLWCWVAIADVGIGCCLTQFLVWPTYPPP